MSCTVVCQTWRPLSICEQLIFFHLHLFPSSCFLRFRRRMCNFVMSFTRTPQCFPPPLSAVLLFPQSTSVCAPLILSVFRPRRQPGQRSILKPRSVRVSSAGGGGAPPSARSPLGASANVGVGWGGDPCAVPRNPRCVGAFPCVLSVYYR